MNRMDRGPLVRGSRESVCATRLKLFAQRVTIFTLTSLTVSGLVAPLAMAQVTALGRAQAPLSPEARAIMLRAKRQAVKVAPRLEPRSEAESSTSSAFNSAQGPGPGPIGPGPGLRPVSSACIGRCVRSSFIFWPAAFHDEPKPGGTSSAPEHGSYRRGEWHDNYSAI